MTTYLCGVVAQSVEQLLCKQKVAGSSPVDSIITSWIVGRVADCTILERWRLSEELEGIIGWKG